MRKPEIIHYKGKDVVYIDLSNLKSKDEIIQLEKQASEMIRIRPVKSVYTLTNMEGMFLNNDIKSFRGCSEAMLLLFVAGLLLVFLGL